MRTKGRVTAAGSPDEREAHLKETGASAKLLGTGGRCWGGTVALGCHNLETSCPEKGETGMMTHSFKSSFKQLSPDALCGWGSDYELLPRVD